jgi:hypothetical protein
MELDKLTMSKIDKFFDAKSTQDSMKYAHGSMQKMMQAYAEECSDDFLFFLKEQFKIKYADIIKTEVKHVVSELLKGNEDVLIDYHLAPNDWLFEKEDESSIRTKLVEDFAHIIKDAHLHALEQEIVSLKEMLSPEQRYR